MSRLALASRGSISAAAGFFNRARLGFPRHFFQGSGGIGDDLLCTTVFHELRRRHVRGVAFTTQYPGLIEGNPDLDAVISCPRPRLGRWLREGLPFVRLGYAHYDSATDRDEPPNEHILAMICRLAGITGSVDLRPYLFLTPEELAAGCLAENQVVIQSSGQAAAHHMQNKEWFSDRFQAVCDYWRTRHTVIQIGSPQDPLLEGAQDMRGKTSLRQSAALLANTSVFIGLVGFLMHLARAVDCRSVIVYGGRETPQHTGYVANRNLTGTPHCSPCWLRNRCEYDRVCMRMIEPEAVIKAAEAQMAKWGLPLEVETTFIGVGPEKEQISQP